MQEVTHAEVPLSSLVQRGGCQGSAQGGRVSPSGRGRAARERTRRQGGGLLLRVRGRRRLRHRRRAGKRGRSRRCARRERKRSDAGEDDGAAHARGDGRRDEASRELPSAGAVDSLTSSAWVADLRHTLLLGALENPLRRSVHAGLIRYWTVMVRCLWIVLGA